MDVEVLVVKVYIMAAVVEVVDDCPINDIVIVANTETLKNHIGTHVVVLNDREPMTRVMDDHSHG